MQTRIEGRKLIVEIDLDGQMDTTQRGNVTVARTMGWQKIEDGVSMNLYVVRKIKH